MTVFKVVTKVVFPSGANADVHMNNDDVEDDDGDCDSAENWR